MGNLEKIADGIEKLEMMFYVALASITVFAVASAVSFLAFFRSIPESVVVGGFITAVLTVSAYILGSDVDE